MRPRKHRYKYVQYFCPGDSCFFVIKTPNLGWNPANIRTTESFNGDIVYSAWNMYPVGEYPNNWNNPDFSNTTLAKLKKAGIIIK